MRLNDTYIPTLERVPTTPDTRYHNRSNHTYLPTLPILLFRVCTVVDDDCRSQSRYYNTCRGDSLCIFFFFLMQTIIDRNSRRKKRTRPSSKTIILLRITIRRTQPRRYLKQFYLIITSERVSHLRAGDSPCSSTPCLCTYIQLQYSCTAQYGSAYYGIVYLYLKIYQT